MGVVVQELIEPLVSGVCFTSHPITDDADYMFVEAAWGLGDLIVGGRVTPDSYVYHRRSRTLVEKSINSQETARVLIGGELCDVAVGEARRSSEKLPDSLLRQLADACEMIVEHYRQPQDIEFAVMEDAIYFLQSRPITTQL
jgi:pyruvate, water dikinase